MIDIEDASIRRFIYHPVKANGEAELSDTVQDCGSDDAQLLLKKVFLRPFTSMHTTYTFKHDVDIDLNVLYRLAQQAVDGEKFVAVSQQIQQHLKSVSKHPNIKDGELFVVKFDNIKLNKEIYSGLGIYKIEEKENFIETRGANLLEYKKGIGNKRPDKACLILFTEAPYTLFIIDNAATETDYWQNEFIKAELKKDNVNQTSQFLSLTKSFVTETLPSEFEVSKADQIDMLNRSVAYFKKHEQFDKDEFEQEVLQDKDVIKSFRNFDTVYRDEHDLEIAEDFEISAQAVKKQARIFKSVLKLDKNFHVYIHGNRNMIEQGVDADGRKYYKLYFEQEM